MNAPLDIAQERYGRLIAISRAPSIGRRTAWLFICDCGTEKIIRVENVRNGDARSCGCLRNEVTAKRSTTHGHRIGRKTSRTLKSYEHAKGRCFNKSDPKYPHYGERGITMCDEWANSFEAFLKYMGECPSGKTLGRINVNKGYEPGNCRWETSFQQARSRTDNVFVEHNGENLVLKDYAAIVGVDYKRLHYFHRTKGLSIKDAVSHAR